MLVKISKVSWTGQRHSPKVVDLVEATNWVKTQGYDVRRADDKPGGPVNVYRGGELQAVIEEVPAGA